MSLAQPLAGQAGPVVGVAAEARTPERWLASIAEVGGVAWLAGDAARGATGTGTVSDGGLNWIA
ncbi:hypothetical protein [Methylobacterium sp. Leaf88]|uniref:hypothetical protein n=1 Tax=Methylobacterium sp. Leaf88 TaxID=1736244 RepID=UPI0006FF57E2|nr:hypothetical protein [Methylobacterium sp. Leaf88]KQO64596.1 hypothetical protein ASF20_21715 [Methylobacterium sp. Leaf88]